ncbi:hypothetical protein [Haloprofundus salilacus]|uniref:hypothetical protein n=1 Tax=Haloprofundus salilacus TaxID=2876190 RepID=UPI001CCC496C|nr:hypothetical protein [Haloprofundus salilacus]
MVSFADRLADGWEKAEQMTTLALVPVVVTLTNFQNIVNLLSASRYGGGMTFLIPAGVVDLWSFVSVPTPQQKEVNVNINGLPVGSLEAAAFNLALVFLTTLVHGALVAGYFGSIRDVLTTGEYDFERNVRRYFVTMLGYGLLPILAMLPMISLGLTLGNAIVPLVLLSIPLMLAATYLFAATPYLVVLRELTLASALVESYRVTTTGEFFRFALLLVAVGLPLSLALSTVVRLLGIVGIVGGALLLAPVGLACNAATMRLVADVDPESPSLGAWDYSRRGDDETGPAPTR